MSGQHEQTTRWQSCTVPLQDDQALREAIVAIYKELYQKYFANLAMINPRLPIEIRAFRRIEQWRVFLLLTPWMLVRVYVSDGAPGIVMPQGWSAAERENASYTLFGPMLELTILDSEQKVHLAFNRQIGHYLIQPLVLSMLTYDSAEAVYDAWRHVIQTRTENMKQLNRCSMWREEVSRREFFTKLVKNSE